MLPWVACLRRLHDRTLNSAVLLKGGCVSNFAARPGTRSNVVNEQHDVSWKDAWQQKHMWATLVDRKVTHLLFITSLCAIAAMILFFIPTSGGVFLITSVSGTICAGLSLVFGVRVAWIHSRAQKQITDYRQALDLPSPPESARSQWEDRILRWCFRGLIALSALLALGELALLWQGYPAIRGHLILLAVTLLMAAGGLFMLRIMRPPVPPKQTKEQ